MSGLDLKSILVLSVGIIVGQIAISSFLRNRRLSQSQNTYSNDKNSYNNKKTENNFSSGGVQNNINNNTSIYDQISKGISDIGKKV